MADESKPQPKVDTGQLRAIVEETVETSLSKKLSDRPTRAEVENMIGQRVTSAIDQLQTRIANDRKQQMDSLEKMLDAKLGALNQAIDRLIAHSAAETTQLRKDIEDNESRINTMSHAVTRLGETQVMMLSTTNDLRRTIFGGEGDGPASMFSTMNKLETAIEALSVKIDIRLIPLERWISTRSAIEQQARSIGRFIFTTWQGRVVLAIGVVLLFKALSLDYWAERFFEALTTGEH